MGWIGQIGSTISNIGSNSSNLRALCSSYVGKIEKQHGGLTFIWTIRLISKKRHKNRRILSFLHYYKEIVSDAINLFMRSKLFQSLSKMHLFSSLIHKSWIWSILPCRKRTNIPQLGYLNVHFFNVILIIYIDQNIIKFRWLWDINERLSYT